MRRLIAALALLLTGCWMGDGLYSAGDATSAMPPGIYRVTESNGNSRTDRVSLLPDGMTQIEAESGGNHDIIGFAPLDSEGRAFVQWGTPSGERSNVQTYNLVERHANGEFVFYMPSCEGEEAEIARSAGATVEPGRDLTTCRFHTRASLESAMRRLTIRPDRVFVRMVRVGDNDG